MTTPAGFSVSTTSTPLEMSGEEKIKEMFGEIPEHAEFVSMVLDAQIMANERQERVPYSWRGYKSCVFPNLPKFQPSDLKERLRVALKGIVNITPKERQVCFY